MTPYACRHSDNSAFMCKTSALNLVNPSDVFTWQRVEVDSSFGGCSTGAYNCSTYSDCNPSTAVTIYGTARAKQAPTNSPARVITG